MTDYELVWQGLSVVIPLGFGLLIIGLKFKNPVYVLFSGLIWILGGLLVFTEINPAWMVLFIGLGIMVLYEGIQGVMKLGQESS